MRFAITLVRTITSVAYLEAESKADLRRKIALREQQNEEHIHDLAMDGMLVSDETRIRTIEPEQDR